MAGRIAAPVAAGLATALLIAVSGVAVWRHVNGAAGDDPATRLAVHTPVEAAIAEAEAHSALCAGELTAITRTPGPDAGATASGMTLLETCGATARRLAEQGYGALDVAAGITTVEAAPDGAGSPGRAAYLDASGSLLSVYELQGDDFDVIFDALHHARLAGTPLAGLSEDVARSLGNSTPDIAAAQDEQARALSAYHRGG